MRTLTFSAVDAADGEIDVRAPAVDVRRDLLERDRVARVADARSGAERGVALEAVVVAGGRAVDVDEARRSPTVARPTRWCR